jgi:hypothetical protein
VSAVDLSRARGEEQRRRIAAALRAEWRMIASVSLRAHGDDEGFEAEVRLDPIVVKASAEQQGYPETPAALAAAELRRHAAIDECVQRLNERLVDADRIRAFTVVGQSSQRDPVRMTA